LHRIADLLGVISGPVEVEFKGFPNAIVVEQRSFDSNLLREQMRGKKAGAELPKLGRVRLLR
jgi:hypothetical protein